MLKGRPFFKHNCIGRETTVRQEQTRTKAPVCSIFVRGCNYSVVRGKNNGTRRKHTDKSCNFPLCREKLEPGWAAGEHVCRGAQVYHPSFSRNLSPRDQAEVVPCWNFPKEGCSELAVQVRRSCAAPQVHSSELRGQGWRWALTQHPHFCLISS